MIPKANWQHYDAVIRAWRIARWAGHAWGNVPDGGLAEVWNVCPSLTGFAQILPGYIIAKRWIVEGPAGWGILGPELVGTDEQALRVWVGVHSQLRVDCYPQQTVVVYEHPPRQAQAVVKGDVSLVTAEGVRPAPRDWARIARVLLEAYDLQESSNEQLLDNFRWLAQDGADEFERYFAMRGPEIFASPAVFAGVE